MEIINNNFVNTERTKFYDVSCPHCQSELRVESSDLNMYGGCACPCCGEYINDNVIRQNDKKVKSPTYPESFFNYSDGVNISDDEINKWIKKIINELKESPTGNYQFIASGNTFVSAYKDDNEISIRVSKNYYEASCDFDGNVLD